MARIAFQFSLAGKRALVTGSSRGLGPALADAAVASRFVNGHILYVDGASTATV